MKMKKKIIFVSLSMLVLLSLSIYLTGIPRSVYADTLTIQPSHDTFVYGRAGYTYRSYGLYDNMRALSNSEGNQRTWLKFDLSTVPSGASISSATLELYYFDYIGNNPSGRTYECYHCTDDSWSEASINWVNAPNLACSLTYSSTVPSSFGWMSWDVTSDVQSDCSGDGASSWRIMDSSEDSSLPYAGKFYSKEHGSSVPRLVVIYSLGPEEPEEHPFTVREGASQITVTVRWSTTSNDSSVTLSLLDPSSTTIEEASMGVYDRLTIDVDASGSKTYTGIKRASYPASPGSVEAGDWSVIISKTGVSSYTCDIEVN